MIELLTDENLKESVFYSRWHSVSRKSDDKFVSYYDLNIELVASILNTSNDSYLVGTYLTDLIDLSNTSHTETPEMIIWESGEAGRIIFENKSNGLRFNGYFESFKDLGDKGLKPIGTYCLFTDSMEEAIAETWLKMVELYNDEMDKDREVNDYPKRLDNIKEFIESWEDWIREHYPEYIIGAKI